MISDEEKNVFLYIEIYFELFDIINLVIDIVFFQEELEKYSNNLGEMSLCWMVQFFMVLGFGLFVFLDFEFVIVIEFMLVVEVCLMQILFMFCLILVSLKVMIFMVVVK